MDNDGNIKWSRCYGGTYNDYFLNIISLSNGNYIIAGRTESNDGDVTGFHGGADIWILEIDSVGNILWQKCYGGSAGESLQPPSGGSTFIKTSDNGFLVSVQSNSTDGDITQHNGGPLDLDAWIFKIDSVGNLEWQKTIGGSNEELGVAITEAGSKKYLAAISTLSTDGDLTGLTLLGNIDILLVQLDSTGNISDKRIYGGSSQDIINRIIKCSDGGFFMAGTTISYDDVNGAGTGWGIKLDESLDIQWSYRFGCANGGPETAMNCIETPDSGFILCGFHDGDCADNLNPTYGHEDYWCAKTNANGQFEWQEAFGGNAGDECFNLSVLPDGRVFLAGFTNSANGLVTGFKGISDGWIVALNNYSQIPYLNNSFENEVKLYPNPFTDNCLIELTEKTDVINQLQVFNYVGDLIQKISPISNKYEFSRKNLSTGIYCFSIITKKGIVVEKKVFIQ